MRQRFSIAAAAATVALCLVPGTAFALDTFVEPDTGNDANNCTQAAVGGGGAGPCATIDAAVTKAVPTSGTVRIDRGDTYGSTVVLSDGVSLVGEELNASDTGAAIIDPGAGSAILVDIAEVAGTIRGLTLRGNNAGIFTQGNVAQITQNVFDDTTDGTAGVFLFGTATALVNANTFSDDGTGTNIGVAVGESASTVRDNTFAGYYSAVGFSGSGMNAATSAPLIASNTITGTHQSGSGGSGISGGADSNATIVGNSVSAPGAGDSAGISVNGNSQPATTGVTLRNNQVRGAHTNGIDIRDTGLAASMNSDLVSGATNAGLNIEDQNADSPVDADVTATNITVWGNTQDISGFQNLLTLDSSITEDPIQNLGGVTCAISFSRGPTTSGTPCQTFQTIADPLFVNAAAGDFHLQAASPMIDAGNPAAPGVGITDIDGEPRALDFDVACPANPRRDIGADEVPPPSQGCPTANPDSATVVEDSGTNAIDVLANDANGTVTNKQVASVSQPASGTSAITGGGTGVSYAPAADFCGADSFTYTLTGGSQANVTITVTCVGDPAPPVTQPTPPTQPAEPGKRCKKGQKLKKGKCVKKKRKRKKKK